MPYILSSSDDMLIKLWDWEKVCPDSFHGLSTLSEGLKAGTGTGGLQISQEEPMSVTSPGGYVFQPCMLWYP